MTAFVDTNVLVRHLTGEPRDQARRAGRYLAGGEELHLADLIVAELVYVLQSVYGLHRATVAGLVRAVVVSERMQVVDVALLLRAVELYEHDGLAFADAYLVASAERSGVLRVVSFDRGIDRVGTVERIEP